jgi:hypothetical protein
MPDCIPGSLAHLRWRPLLLTGLFRDVLARHFSDAATIEDPALKSLLWRDGLDTGILIESINRWRGDLVEKRPAVIIKRNAYTNVRITINDLSGTDKRGFDNFTTFWVGSHTLFCIHGTGAGAELLATETQRELTQFGPVFRQQLNLAKFQVTEVGTIHELEEASENFVIPVTVGWAYQETWSIRPESLPLKSIQMDPLCLLNC